MFSLSSEEEKKPLSQVYVECCGFHFQYYGQGTFVFFTPVVLAVTMRRFLSLILHPLLLVMSKLVADLTAEIFF